jgi:hypothetical protein
MAGAEKFRVQVGLLHGNPALSVARADPASTRGWRSRYYAHKEPAISVLLEVHQPRAILWSFFGFESDSVGLTGDRITILSPTGETTINLLP